VINQDWAAGLISAGAVAGITSVLLVMLMGQPRIFFAMSRDGLLPEKVSKVHPRFGTPYITTIITGAVVAVVAMLVPIGTVAELTNIGTLFAFVIVSCAVVALRRMHPHVPRSFHVPLVGIIAPLAVLFCLYLMFSLPVLTWIRFLLWLDGGLVLYYYYGRRKSRLADAAGIGHLPVNASYRLQFFGITLLVNGVLFGLLSLMTGLRLVGRASWDKMGIRPHTWLIVSAVVGAVGIGMWALGRKKAA
jgi:amino acid transporter